MTVSLMKKQLGLVYLLAPRFNPPTPHPPSIPELSRAVPGQATLRRVELEWGELNQTGEGVG